MGVTVSLYLSSLTFYLGTSASPLHSQPAYMSHPRLCSPLATVLATVVTT